VTANLPTPRILWSWTRAIPLGFHGGDRVILIGGCLSIAMAQDLSEFATQVRR
jgi:hypothetical protein